MYIEIVIPFMKPCMEDSFTSIILVNLNRIFLPSSNKLALMTI